jgi:uncharacterized spore protein YtfJ
MAVSQDVDRSKRGLYAKVLGRKSMEKEIQKMLDALTDLRKRANANAVFGKPVASEGRVVIPVAEVTYDFDMEIEDGQGAGEGEGGGGMNVRPVAVLEVTPADALVKPIVDEQRLALVGALLVGWAVFWVAWTLGKIFGRQE